ncbi:MAG: DNA repair exonuclease [Deltaproteobacteria bacterium]|nr:DNA repair exonuclease [Deltaproteobacteria bacterium]
MADPVRILLVADTHLGFDLPVRPRIERRRRGPDFFACFEKALEPALRGEIDLVVHGGDLLFRSKVRPSLVLRAFEPLFRVADAGVPVFVVPGNHERSAIPYALLTRRERVFVFDEPRTFRVEVGATTVALSGFPNIRRDVSTRFGDAFDQTGWRKVAADVRVLCLHQIVEGATVGPVGFTFRRGHDVISGRDLPAGLAAVLCGHVHRAQVLRTDLVGRPLAAPVFYPGSVERTAFAEQDEIKGYFVLSAVRTGSPGGALKDERFCPLPARPMATVELDVTGLSESVLFAAIREALRAQPDDAVVRIRLSGVLRDEARGAVRAAALRKLAPETMNVELSLVR